MAKCPNCHRRFRDAASYELYMKRQAVLSSLRDDTPCAHLGDIELDRPARHRAEHHHYRTHGDKIAA